MKIRSHQGVTLIELMITVVIIGILAAIAYPSYRNYTTQTRRSDAQIALTRLANDMEKFYSDCNRYPTSLTATRDCTANFGLARSNALSLEQHYLLSIALNASATTYTLTADPNGAGVTGQQNNDGGFRLDSTGVKQWDKANNNSYSSKWTDK